MIWGIIIGAVTMLAWLFTLALAFASGKHEGRKECRAHPANERRGEVTFKNAERN